MPDLLGLNQQQDTETTTDYLGQRIPISFKNQAALPTGIGGPTAASTSAAPPTIAGAGTTAPSGPTGSGFDQLAGAAIPGTTEGGGEGGGGEGVGVSAPGFSTSLGTAPSSFNLGNITLADLGLTPEGSATGRAGITIGPTGTISPTTGERSGLLDTGLKLAASAAKIPVSQNLLSLAAKIVPQLAPIVAPVLGPAGLLSFAIQLAHSGASATPGTIANLEANLGKVATSPETELEFGPMQQSILDDVRAALSGVSSGQATFITNPDVAAALSKTGVPGYAFQGGYVFGGGRPANAPGTSLGQTAPPQAANLQEALTPTQTFSDLASALGFGGPSGPSGPGPTGTPGSEGPAGLGEGGPAGGGAEI